MKNKALLIILLILVLFVGITAGYFWGVQKENENTQKNTNVSVNTGDQEIFGYITEINGRSMKINNVGIAANDNTILEKISIIPPEPGTEATVDIIDFSEISSGSYVDILADQNSLAKKITLITFN